MSAPWHEGEKHAHLAKAVCTEAITVTWRESDCSWGFSTPLLPRGRRVQRCSAVHSWHHGGNSGSFLCWSTLSWSTISSPDCTHLAPRLFKGWHQGVDTSQMGTFLNAKYGGTHRVESKDWQIAQILAQLQKDTYVLNETSECFYFTWLKNRDFFFKQIQMNQNVAFSYLAFHWDLSSFYCNFYVSTEYILFPCLSVGISLNLSSLLWLVAASWPDAYQISQILHILQYQIFFWEAAHVKFKIQSSSFPAWSPR